MATLRLSEPAELDLTEIWDYIARDNPSAADRYLDRIQEHCHDLAESSRLGRLRPELAPGLRSSPFQSHVVFYEEREDGIEVIRVLHGARDVPAILG